VAAPGRRHRVEPAVLDYSDAQRVAKKGDLIASTGVAEERGSFGASTKTQLD